MRSKGIYINIALLLSTLILVFFVSEITLRIAASKEDKKILSDKILSSKKPSPESNVLLHEAIQLSDNRRIIYELKENLRVNLVTPWMDGATHKVKEYVNHPLRTSSAGNRCLWDNCKGYSTSKPDNTKRIVGIGDSIMYGFNIDYKDSYLPLLENALNRYKIHKSRWETINLAVPGYNAVMEVEILKDKGLNLDPDIVIVGYCSNDLNLPNFIRNEQDFSLKKSFFIDFIATRLGMLDKKIKGETEFVGADIHLSDPSEVPSMYKDMVGWDSYVTAMRELSELSKKHGFKVMVVYFTHGWGREEINESSRQLSKKLGFEIVDMEPVIDKIMKENNISNYRLSNLAFSQYDPHPSVLTHPLIAQEILIKIAATAR